MFYAIFIDDAAFFGHFYHPFCQSNIQVLWEVTPCQLPLATSQGVIYPEDLNFMSAGVGIPTLAATLII